MQLGHGDLDLMGGSGNWGYILRMFQSCQVLESNERGKVNVDSVVAVVMGFLEFRNLRNCEKLFKDLPSALLPVVEDRGLEM